MLLGAADTRSLMLRSGWIVYEARQTLLSGPRGSIEANEYSSRSSRVAIPGGCHRSETQPGAGVVHAAGGPLAARIPGIARTAQHAGRVLRARSGLRDHPAADTSLRR